MAFLLEWVSNFQYNITSCLAERLKRGQVADGLSEGATQPLLSTPER